MSFEGVLDRRSQRNCAERVVTKKNVFLPVGPNLVCPTGGLAANSIGSLDDVVKGGTALHTQVSDYIRSGKRERVPIRDSARIK